jgi:hypothetical protein
LNPAIAAVLAVMLLVSPVTNVAIAPGVVRDIPRGYVISNLDPSLNSSFNDEIYDPNFLPGFEAGLTNTSLSWHSGNGYAEIGYSIGPWTRQESSTIPHFAVGPQCCNFQEVPHTQQFRRVAWGDYYYVRTGLGPPGINSENFTAEFGAPTSYVGLRTDWDWTVQFSLNWTSPVLMNPANERGSIGIAVTQYVPSAPGKLVYSLINFWMDSNSSRGLTGFSDGSQRAVNPPNVVVYHPLQINALGNQTITMDMSPFLADTIRALSLPSVEGQPPVISYVYLNVEGYNFAWNTTLWSFKVLTPLVSSPSAATFILPTVILAAAALVVLYQVSKKKVLPVAKQESPVER